MAQLMPVSVSAPVGRSRSSNPQDTAALRRAVWPRAGGACPGRAGRPDPIRSVTWPACCRPRRGPIAARSRPGDWALFAAIGLIWGSSFLLIADRARGVRARPRYMAAGAWPARQCWRLVPRRPDPDRARGPSPARGAVRPVGGRSVHAVPARPAARQLRGGRHAERRPADHGRVDRLDHAAAAADPAAHARASCWAPAASRRSRSPRRARAAARPSASLMLLAAVMCYGVAINMAAPLQQRYGSSPVMARMLALAAVWTAPFGLASIPASLTRVVVARVGDRAGRGRHRPRVRADGPARRPGRRHARSVRDLSRPGRGAGARGRCCTTRTSRRSASWASRW